VKFSRERVKIRRRFSLPDVPGKPRSADKDNSFFGEDLSAIEKGSGGPASECGLPALGSDEKIPEGKPLLLG